MARFKNKATGKVIEAHQFDGTTLSMAKITEFIGDDIDMIVGLNYGDWVTYDYNSQGAKYFLIVSYAQMREEFTPFDGYEQQAMSESDQVQAFGDEIWRVIERFMDEFDIPLSGAVGALEIIKMKLILSQNETNS